jgi:cellulose synthase/poly-beta-1,6-N-acetylglucosamine synthase-like glycosyltransferase
VFAIISIITLLLAVLYGLMILYFKFGWDAMPLFVPGVETGSWPGFSIIIPARNESAHIINRLSDIIAQNYPAEDFEIIVMDDFSEDDTAQRVLEFIKDHPGFNIRLIRMADEPAGNRNSYKKLAITTGIRYSRFDWIVTTDADCRNGPKWLETFASVIRLKNPQLISAPVIFSAPQDFFGKFQALEFTGLIGIGASSISRQHPNMCNGANLAYRKTAFNEIDGFEGNDKLASGDDEFLMHKIHNKWPEDIVFLKNTDAIVYTQPAETYSGFISQRRRWVSKSRKYARKSITAILGGAYLFHACLFLCIIAAIFNPWYLLVFITAFGIKVAAEYAFLKNLTGFFRQQNILGGIVLSAFLYIFYVLFIGIYGNFGTYEWKGREVN